MWDKKFSRMTSSAMPDDRDIGKVNNCYNSSIN